MERLSEKKKEKTHSVAIAMIWVHDSSYVALKSGEQLLLSTV